MGGCSRELVEITRKSFVLLGYNCERRQPKTISSVLVFIPVFPPKALSRNTEILTERLGHCPIQIVEGHNA
jgi:hypothetical protein